MAESILDLVEAPSIPRESTLFGHDPTARIVAVEPSERSLIVWRREEGDRLERVEEVISPWLLTTRPDSRLGGGFRALEDGEFRFLYEFPTWGDFQSALSYVRESHVEHLAYASAVKQALVRTGKTHFKGMTMADVLRMQVDIETETLSAESAASRILIIAVADNRGRLETITGDESDMLRRFVALVREIDPDILEGHNIYGFDLPYLLARADALGIPLGIGRDGSTPRMGRQRNFAIGGISRPFAPIYIYGRHVLDTFLAVQRFDWARGALSSYGLKHVAQVFGISEADRVEMPRDQIGEIFRSDPERVLTYCCHDVKETAKLAEIVAPTEFYMAQMVPDSYGASALAGQGEKINSILVRAYLAQGKGIPRPKPPRPYPGGYTEIRLTGVIDRVVKADVESLYPSIMLAERIKPESDTLDVFLPALAELTERRLDAKARARTGSGPEQQYWDGLQSSFKVLINSFYGYLGAGSFHFNDYEAAERVTVRGQELVKQIADRLEATGSRVIEIDTDGVYFVPPESVQGEESERAYVTEIASTLPDGIRLAFDGRYRSMVSLKTKNYVLWDYDGGKRFTGASLRSRADERFGREFITQAVDLLLEKRTEEIGELYKQTIEDLLEDRIPIQKLARRERVTDKTFTSASKTRSADVAMGIAIGEYVTVYERKNGQLGLLADYEANGRDHRIEYYADKLHKFASRLREAFESDFDRLVPRPSADGSLPPVQETLDLFE